MIGSFRLPTHSRDDHMNFFDDPFLTHQNQRDTLGSIYKGLSVKSSFKIL